MLVLLPRGPERAAWLFPSCNFCSEIGLPSVGALSPGGATGEADLLLYAQVVCGEVVLGGMRLEVSVLLLGKGCWPSVVLLVVAGDVHGGQSSVCCFWLCSVLPFCT